MNALGLKFSKGYYYVSDGIRKWMPAFWRLTTRGSYLVFPFHSKQCTGEDPDELNAYSKKYKPTKEEVKKSLYEWVDQEVNEIFKEY